MEPSVACANVSTAAHMNSNDATASRFMGLSFCAERRAETAWCGVPRPCTRVDLNEKQIAERSARLPESRSRSAHRQVNYSYRGINVGSAPQPGSRHPTARSPRRGGPGIARGDDQK